jgi:hypothetical protein
MDKCRLSLVPASLDRRRTDQLVAPVAPYRTPTRGGSLEVTARGGDVTDQQDRGRTVIVGIDGSESALRAVLWAAAEASRRRVPLRVVTSFEWRQDDRGPSPSQAHRTKPAVPRLTQGPEDPNGPDAKLRSRSPTSSPRRFPARTVTMPWDAPAGTPTTVALILTTREDKPVNRHYFNAKIWKPAPRTAGRCIPAAAPAGSPCVPARPPHVRASIEPWWTPRSAAARAPRPRRLEPVARGVRCSSPPRCSPAAPC